jgi:hypothetical protein
MGVNSMRGRRLVAYREGQMPAYVTPYDTIDAAALAGFQRILRNNLTWQSYEYGFLVFERSRDIVRQLGHEGFMDTATQYFYTEPHTNQSKSSVDQSISAQYAMSARALCHTHPTPGTFSSADFRGFKKLKELKQHGVMRGNPEQRIFVHLTENIGVFRR